MGAVDGGKTKVSCFWPLALNDHVLFNPLRHQLLGQGQLLGLELLGHRVAVVNGIRVIFARCQGEPHVGKHQIDLTTLRPGANPAPMVLVLLFCAVENLSKCDQQFQGTTVPIRQTGGIA